MTITYINGYTDLMTMAQMVLYLGNIHILLKRLQMIWQDGNVRTDLFNDKVWSVTATNLTVTSIRSHFL
jgi:hypothetical protein